MINSSLQCGLIIIKLAYIEITNCYKTASAESYFKCVAFKVID